MRQDVARFAKVFAKIAQSKFRPVIKATFLKAENKGTDAITYYRQTLADKDADPPRCLNCDEKADAWLRLRIARDNALQHIPDDIDVFLYSCLSDTCKRALDKFADLIAGCDVSEPVNAPTAH